MTDRPAGRAHLFLGIDVRWFLFVLAVTTSGLSRPTLAQDGWIGAEPYYFYRPHLGYGTQAQVHPLRMVLNGGFGILQMENRDDRPLEVAYRQGTKNVWRNLHDPFAAIQAEGWGSFLTSQVFPFGGESGNAQYWPNYTLHLVGGGMSYRLMAEWFAYHGFSHPKLWSGATMFVYHFLNEVVENDRRDGWRTDPVADLYIFDPLGIALFSSDRVNRFFGRTLNMQDWSYQPALDFGSGELHNQGQNFALKWRLPGSERWSLFYHWGTHGELGLSYRRGGDDSISAGVGLKAKNLIELDVSDTAELALSGGIFYDRNNSLLASVLMAATKDYRYRLNLYPGLFHVGIVTPGLMLVVDADHEAFFGVTFGNLTHLPFGAIRRL